MIGILGGMGSFASLRFEQRLAMAFAEQGRLPPDLVHLALSHQFTDRTDFLLGQSDANPAVPAAQQAACLMRFARDNGQSSLSLCVPCFTFHAAPIWRPFVDALPKPDRIGFKLLNMVTLTEQALLREFGSGARVGVLCTTGSRFTQLFSHPEISWIFLPEDEQRLLMDAIYHPAVGLKFSYPPAPCTLQRVTGLIERLLKLGADTVVLACTELALLLPQLDDWPVVDPQQTLIERLLRHPPPTAHHEQLIQGAVQ